MNYRFLLSTFVLLVIYVSINFGCAPREPVLTIQPISLPDSIKIHDPDTLSSNGWLGTPDTALRYDSILVRLRVSYSGATDAYITEVIWKVKNPKTDSIIKTYNAGFFPIRIQNGQSANLNFFIYFDNITAYKVDLLSDSLINYRGSAMVELQLAGSTYEQFIKSNRITFPLSFVP
ncbi:MAG: hypothetical protein ABIM31_00655 [candidate division WOR-3 bacterium]